MATNINSQIYKFSETEKRTLEDCRTRAQSILDVINELEQHGCTVMPLNLKCPMEKLQAILRKHIQEQW